MNRRLFLASLFAPFAARFAPKPRLSTMTIRRGGEILEYRAYIAKVFAIPPHFLPRQLATVVRIPIDMLQGSAYD